jgi:hypothetical protein
MGGGGFLHSALLLRRNGRMMRSAVLHCTIRKDGDCVMVTKQKIASGTNPGIDRCASQQN